MTHFSIYISKIIIMAELTAEQDSTGGEYQKKKKLK
jgi:hypothetical protein